MAMHLHELGGIVELPNESKKMDQSFRKTSNESMNWISHERQHSKTKKPFILVGFAQVFVLRPESSRGQSLLMFLFFFARKKKKKKKKNTKRSCGKTEG